MRILVVQESGWHERGPHQQHHLMERMVKRGHAVQVIDFDIDWAQKDGPLCVPRRETKAEPKVIDGQFIPIVRPAMLRVPIIAYLLIPFFHSIEILRSFRKFKPNVVVGLGILNTFLAAVVSHLMNVPFVYYLIDSLHTLSPKRWMRPIARAFERATLTISSATLAINKHLAEYASKMGSTQNPKVISAGIDTNRFSPEVDGNHIRKHLDIPEDALVLFFMGWLYEFSGVVEVAKAVLKSDANIYFLVLGRGPAYQDLEDISNNGLRGNHVILVDWIDYEDVPYYVGASDICILPAEKNEIMKDIVPIKMYEYLGSGKPVICTPLPGIVKEFGRDTGVVYAKDSQAVMKEAKSIFGDDATYNSLQEDAIEFSKPLDWIGIANQFEKTLFSLLDSSLD